MTHTIPAPYTKGAPIRWDRDTESFLFRCQSCALRGNGAWWPLEAELARLPKSWTKGYATPVLP